MIALALLGALIAQDTTGLSPKAQAMLGRFPPPAAVGQVTIAAKFSTDTAWVGEQVELVTAAWFPRELRDRLRRPPTLRAPSLSGLWSVQAQTLPTLVDTRRVRGEVYDLFVVHQTLFPLGPGRIVSPPALLSYSVPTSASYFAPEDRMALESRNATLEVRSPPRGLIGPLAGGPTARRFRLVWRGPSQGLKAGTPALVELVAEGEGNVTLWPSPDITWPVGLRVYPERTEERTVVVGGTRGGEKRFRFTVVADSVGVVTLPAVRYPTFDPVAVTVRVMTAPAFALPVFPSAGRTGDRRPLPVTGQPEVPVVTRLVRHPATGWLLGSLPLLIVVGAFRRRRRQAPPATRSVGDPEAELRRLLGTPLDAGPERVVASLRRRGVPRGDAEQVRRWLTATGRRRYGPVGGETPAPPSAVSTVLARLRQRGALFLLACCFTQSLGAQQDGVARYRGGDYAGAARAFASMTVETPHAAGAWRDLGSALWQSGDDVGAVTAWWRALSLAPRDPLTRAAWQSASALPTSFQRMAPTIPLNRDELMIVALLAAVLAWRLRATRRRRSERVAVLLVILAAATAVGRWHRETTPAAVVREASALRVSPHPAAPALAQANPWTLVQVERREGEWLLVAVRDGARGWLPSEAVAPLAPLD